MLRGRLHGLGRGEHVLLEVADGLHFVGQLTSFQAAGKGDGLIVQRGLGLRQELRDVGSLLLRGVLISLLLESLGNDLLLALRNLRGWIATTASASSTAARHLRLRKLALIRIGLDKHHVGVGFRVAVLGGGVHAHQIARHQLEILERERGRAVGLFLALLAEQIHRGFGASVDRIVQRDARESVLIGNLDGSGDLFNGAGMIIAIGTHQRDLRRVSFACFDEKILANSNGLALLNAGDVIDAIVIHFEGAVIGIILSA